MAEKSLQQSKYQRHREGVEAKLNQLEANDERMIAAVEDLSLLVKSVLASRPEQDKEQRSR